MKNVVLLVKNRDDVLKVVGEKYGERYYILNIKEIIKKNIFGVSKKIFEVSICILEQG